MNAAIAGMISAYLLYQSFRPRSSWVGRDHSEHMYRWDTDPGGHMITIHHSGNNPFNSPQLMDRRGIGIPYHFAITRNGTVYEGRPFNTRGGHVYGQNTGNIGIVLIGNFERNMPSDEQLSSLVNLVGVLQTGQSISNDNVVGHRNLDSRSICPGQMLYDFIRERWRVR